MTNRLQILRSSVTGNTPTAGTRAAGEVWVNFPDLQLGTIDAARNAQRLVAVRYFSTTANYATGDFVIQAGALYAAKGAITAGAFSAAQWVKVAAATDPDGPYLALAGGTLTGLLTLSGPPSNPLHAATKAYADSLVASGPYLPIAGGTLTGLVTLSGPPSNPLHAATKAYADSVVSGGPFLPLAGGTLTGALTPAQPSGIVGTTTNNAASAGSIGEVVSSNVVSPGVTLTTATPANVTSVSLTAGDWDVWGQINYAPAGGTTQTAINAAISNASATLAIYPNGSTVNGPASTTAGFGIAVSAPRFRYLLASTTTIYLVAQAGFSGSTDTAYGWLVARRMR